MTASTQPGHPSAATLEPHFARQIRVPGVALLLLAGAGAGGTSTSYSTQLPTSLEQTTAGLRLPVTLAAAGTIRELHRLSGLSWDQLAKLFDVSRRTLHFWASGRTMTTEHEKKVQRALTIVRCIDRGAADLTRSALLTPDVTGELPLDWLASDEPVPDVVARLGAPRPLGSPTRKSRVQPRSLPAAPPPDQLVEALQDRIHPRSGRLLASKPLRRPRSE